MIILFSPTV